MKYKVTDICVSCGNCDNRCPVNAIQEGNLQYEIAEDACIGCGKCAKVCPTGAIQPA